MDLASRAAGTQHRTLMSDRPIACDLLPPADVTTSLVLFIGEALRPDDTMNDSLARAGMRSLWLHGHEQALLASRLTSFDALVLDDSSPGRRTAQAMARLRSRLPCPLIVVGGRADEPNEVDEIVALELGADAYLRRPLAPRRLRAQLAALIRLRTRAPLAQLAGTTMPAPQVAGWSLDRLGKSLARAGRVELRLTEQQASLLQSLMEDAGRIVSRVRLAGALPKGAQLEARSVDVYINRLRRRLCEGGALELRIDTVRGRGFCLLPRDDAATPA